MEKDNIHPNSAQHFGSEIDHKTKKKWVFFTLGLCMGQGGGGGEWLESNLPRAGDLILPCLFVL